MQAYFSNVFSSAPAFSSENKHPMPDLSAVLTDELWETLTLKYFRSISSAFDVDVYQALLLKTCVNGRTVYGGPAKAAVEQQIANIEAFVEAR